MSFKLAALGNQEISLDEQIQVMVKEGAAVGIMDPDLDLIIRLGVVLLDEPAKQLFFLEQWGTGTGYGHVLSWDRVEQLPNQAVFYAGGRIAFVVAPFDEWPELDQDIVQESFAGWKIELVKNRKHYMRFCRNEFRLLTANY